MYVEKREKDQLQFDKEILAKVKAGTHAYDPKTQKIIPLEIPLQPSLSKEERNKAILFCSFNDGN